MKCSTETKGIIMSVLLIGASIATSILSFTTNCNQVIQASGNSVEKTAKKRFKILDIVVIRKGESLRRRNL